MRSLLLCLGLVGLSVTQGCVTRLMWTSKGTTKTQAVTSHGKLELHGVSIEPEGPRLLVDVELIDDNPMLRSAFAGSRTLLALRPRRASLPHPLLDGGSFGDCRLDEFQPCLCPSSRRTSAWTTAV